MKNNKEAKKELIIPVIIFIVILVSIIVTTVMINNRPATDPNLNPVVNSEETNDEPKTENNKMNKIYVNINGEKLKIQLEDNSTAMALAKMLLLTLSMSDLNNNEKYVYLDNSLPTNTFNPNRVETGDVMLFGDNCLVIFYKSFDTDYSYSKIDHIDNLPELGGGEIPIELNEE